VALGEPFPEVLAAARLGAEWAWRALHRELAPAIVGYLRGRGAEAPEDLAAEVFLRLLVKIRDLPRFEGGEAELRSFAFTIAHHRLVDERRSRGRRPEGPACTTELVAEGPRGDAEAEAVESLRIREIRRLIEGLSPDQREVLLLRILGGLNAEEVAAATGRGAWAVRALQRRGILALRKKISVQAVQL
jgi:RNA polymerase sigma-70 factor, ECF subfamily